MRKAALTLLLLAGAHSAWALPFVSSSSVGFIANGKPLALNGSEAVSAADAGQKILAAKATGLNLIHLRLDSLPTSNTPGVPSDAGWKALDKVIALASRAGVYVLPSLSSFRQNGSAAKFSKQLGGQNQSLYLADGRARDWYLALLKAAVTRKNTVSGLLYKDDPAVFGWSLGADLGDPDDPLGERAANWALRSAELTKQLDPKHLVGVHSTAEASPAFGKVAGLDFLAVPAGAAASIQAGLARPLLLCDAQGSWKHTPAAKPLRLGAPKLLISGPGEATLTFQADRRSTLSVDFGEGGLLKNSLDALPGTQAKLVLKGLKAGATYQLRPRALGDDGQAAAGPLLSLSIPVSGKRPPQPAPYSGNIIRSANGKFWDGQKPFRYVGANNYYLRYTSDKAGIAEVLDAARDMGMRVLRCQANGESFDAKGSPGEPLRFFTLGGPNGDKEEVYAHYDYLMDEASKRGLRIIIYIADNWEYYGGLKVRAQWAGLKDKNAFFTDAKAKAAYKQHILKWVNRRNTVNGRLYKDDPTVFAWELCNEPRDEADKSGKQLAAWIDEMSSYWKTVDPKHMVSAGLEGSHNANGEHYSGADFRLCNAPRNIAFSTFHFYPVKDTRRFSLKAAKQAVREYVKISHGELKKPVVMEEYGVEKKYDGELSRLQWTTELAESFLAEGGDGLNYWQLIHHNYDGLDGFEFTPQDTEYWNLFSRLAATLNAGPGGKP